MQSYTYTESSKTVAAGSATAFAISLSQIPSPPTGYTVAISFVYVNLNKADASWAIYTIITELAGNVIIARIENKSSSQFTTSPIITVIWSYIRS